jgi:hypothetical protein
MFCFNSRHMPRIIEWYLLIRPEKISWLRFIFEGYDGLAILSTLSPVQGLVRVQTLDCHFLETMRLLEAMAKGLTPFCVDNSHDETALLTP